MRQYLCVSKILQMEVTICGQWLFTVKVKHFGHVNMWTNSTCFQLSRPCRQCSPMLSGVPVTPLCFPPSHFHLAAQLFLHLFQSQLLLFSIAIDNFLTACWTAMPHPYCCGVSPVLPFYRENPELVAILGNFSFSRAECFPLG